MSLQVYGVPTEIALNQEVGGRLRVFASSAPGEKSPNGVSVQFDVESRDFTVAFTSDTPAKLDRIIMALMKARTQVWG